MEDYRRPKSLKPSQKVKAFTIDEERKILKYIHNSKYYMNYLIAFNTGARMGEINALHYNDIDLNEKTINIRRTISREANGKSFINATTKTKNGEREVPINSFLYTPLKEYIKNKKGKYLFSEVKVLSTAAITSDFKRLISKIEFFDDKNINVSVHKIRHTFATRCIEAGVDAVVLRDILGHADISTTLNTYVDVFNKYRDKNLKLIDNYFTQLYEE